MILNYEDLKNGRTQPDIIDEQTLLTGIRDVSEAILENGVPQAYEITRHHVVLPKSDGNDMAQPLAAKLQTLFARADEIRTNATGYPCNTQEGFTQAFDELNEDRKQLPPLADMQAVHTPQTA